MNPVSKLKHFGEFSLIERIKNIITKSDKEELKIGLGDDTAVIRITEDRALLFTCDIQIQNQHFNLDYLSPYQLGRRAIAVNLSDIAAMGGKPLYALVSLGLTKSLRITVFDDLFRGMTDQLAEFDAAIIGGNLSSSQDQLIVDISMIGEVAPEKVLKRSGARVGDRIFVSGTLGLSAAGLMLLNKYGKMVPDKYAPFVQQHLQPQPRLLIAQHLANSDLVHAMIDISDGLASDINHICQMSDVGVEINISKIPITDMAADIEKLIGIAWSDLALSGGEDYELLFTVREDAPVDAIDQIVGKTGVKLTEIGRIIPKEAGLYTIDQKNTKKILHPKGWDHFK